MKIIFIGLFFSVSFVLVVIAFINQSIDYFAKDKIYKLENAPQANVGIVLGARVLSNQRLSDVLSDRALTAVQLWEKGKIEKILVSGDNGSQYYNEVVPVKNFLIEQGIPENVIFLDYAGFDTYDSVYRARNIFQVKEALIITQAFHLPRAVYLCEKVGINCNGIIADRQSYLKADYFALREKLAKVKAFLDIAFQSQPKFMGEVIDINLD